MTIQIRREKIEELIDALLAAKDRSVIADINAQRCGTKTDWKAANAADDALETRRQNTIDQIVEMIEMGVKII